MGRASFVVLLLGVAAVPAEVPPPADELYQAYTTAVDELRAGQPRRAVADRLRPAVAKHADSYWRCLAVPFLDDLTATADRPPDDPKAPADRRLADATDWGEDGPFARLKAADRAVIGRLIPLLADRTPTRAAEPAFSLHDPLAPQLRVCDLALALIQHHARALFHRDSYTGRVFHQLPDADRKAVAARVAEWWAANKDKTVAAGVRAQLAQAREYPEIVTMAKELFRLPGATADDKAAAIAALRKLVSDGRRHHFGAYAADALAELGDLSPVDVFYREWHDERGLMHDAHITFYLCKHGKRREWELLHAFAREELADGSDRLSDRILPAVFGSDTAATNSYVVPLLGLALTADPPVAAREMVRKHYHSIAGRACDELQKQTGRDFGYARSAPEAEQQAAVAKARAWWQAGGQKQFTFDAIDARQAAKP